MPAEIPIYAVKHSLLRRGKRFRTTLNPPQLPSKGLSEHAYRKDFSSKGYRPSLQISKLFKKLNEKGSFPQKVGIETEDWEPKLSYNYSNFDTPELVAMLRYARALEKRLARKGSQIVHLEGEGVPKLFFGLQDVLSRYLAGSGDWGACLYSTAADREGFGKKNLFEPLRKMTFEVFTKPPQNDEHYLDELWDAVSVHRSVLMHETGQRNGVNAMIIGGSHAQHLIALGKTTSENITHTYLDAHKRKNASREVENYKKHSELIKKLEQIAREEYPSD